jgi:hypothetical protein
MAGVIALDGEPRATSTDGTHRSNYLLSHLYVLEAESVHIMREVAAESERPLRARLSSPTISRGTSSVRPTTFPPDN